MHANPFGAEPTFSIFVHNKISIFALKFFQTLPKLYIFYESREPVDWNYGSSNGLLCQLFIKHLSLVKNTLNIMLHLHLHIEQNTV